jgi:SLA1 homology domain 1, SHD1
MSRILTGTFVITTFLFASNTFVRAQGCGCGTSQPPLRSVTVVSVECAPCSSYTPVGCGMVLSSGSSSGCVSCIGGNYLDQVVIANSIVRENGGGAVNGGAVNGGAVNGGAVNGGAVNGGAVNGGAVNGGAVNGGAVNGGAANGGGRLDPDVLTGSPQGSQSMNAERIWTDSSGLHKRSARFIRIEGTQVILQNAQGRATRVEIQNLSNADQLFLEQVPQTSMKRAFPSNQQHSVASRS